MPNFSGIISPAFKLLFVDAISSLLYDDALTLPCILSYGVTKYEDCINCVYSSIGQKSANKFQDGGPIPFMFGSICPMCNGVGKRAVETTEDINLMVVWDYKEFVNSNTVNSPESDLVQTITFAYNTPKLKRAKEILISTDISQYSRNRFERYADPKPCGFGSSDFVECLWKRSG